MLYLASQSPRRYELLTLLGVPFKRFHVDVDESVILNETPKDYIYRVVQLKKEAALQKVSKEDFVLVADTIVVYQDMILGKPKNFQDAKAMLMMLSGQTHQVYTCICLAQKDNEKLITNISDVTFREITEKEIKAYWQSGEPKDKAGAYGIQGLGSIFIKSIHGSHSAIMGLPLFETAALLEAFGFRILN